MLQSRQLFSSNLPFLLSPPLQNPSLSPLTFHYRPTSTFHSVSAQNPTRQGTWLADATAAPEEGPIELPLSEPSIFATDDGNASPLQVATSVLLTGAISVFLFRSLRRRARRAKELKFRSTGAKKSLKEEALDTLKAMSPSPAGGEGPPSPIQALLGGISAGVIALILYKFTLTVEGSLNRQTLSENFSVRQITVTIRTIVNGLCYLATFVFGLNAIGLFLYSGQLAFSSFMEDDDSSSKESQNIDSNPAIKNPTENLETTSDDVNQSSDTTKQ